MPSATDFPARGRITAIRDGVAVFNPANTNYELHLRVPADFSAPLNIPVEAVIRVIGRKVWTVPSGGNFVEPIFGKPRILQGRVRHATESQLVVQAGTTFVVDFPTGDRSVELPEGPIAVNRLVNVTVLPGATLELLNAAAAAR